MNSKAPIPKFSFLQKIKLFSLGISKWEIPTFTTNFELLKLYSLSKTLKRSSVVVEIGSYIGASSIFIAKALSDDSKLYCIDTWQNDAMTEGNWDSYTEFSKNIKSVKNKIIKIRQTSVEAGINFNEMIDLIFIDGDHSYEGVKKDIDIWFPKLKTGGIIIMHDIGWADGVNKVIQEDIQPYLAKFDNLPNMYWGWKS
jgi:predicted O-methyltransferase YrrM